ncbi:MAG: hypothetical protein CSA62_13680 [Planctomycetota bacterium]|nr:MAG: hypothetical protein CSA62_13680 [Planctomycetota bacterium]
MNTQKLNIGLAGLFLVLTVLSLIKFFGSSANFVQYDEAQRLIPGFTPENVAVVQLTRGESEDPETPPKTQIIFQRKEEGWVMQSNAFPGAQLAAQGTLIEERILARIQRIEANVSTIINEKADEAALKSYGFGAEAWTVTCVGSNGKALAKLQIGRKAGREGDEQGLRVSGSYVKKDDRDVVLISDKPFELFDEAGDWLDKTMVSVDESQVAQIHVMNEQGEILFERIEKKGEDKKKAEKANPSDAQPQSDKPSWKVVRGPEKVGKLRDFSVSTLLARATKITAKEILQGRMTEADAQRTGLLSPAIRVVLTLRDEAKTRYQLGIGSRMEGEQAYYATTSGKPGVLFTLADWDIAEFKKDPKEHFDALPEPKKAEPKKPEPKKAEPKKTEPKKPEQQQDADAGKQAAAASNLPEKKLPAKNAPNKQAPAKLKKPGKEAAAPSKSPKPAGSDAPAKEPKKSK